MAEEDFKNKQNVLTEKKDKKLSLRIPKSKPIIPPRPKDFPASADIPLRPKEFPASADIISDDESEDNEFSSRPYIEDSSLNSEEEALSFVHPSRSFQGYRKTFLPATYPSIAVIKEDISGAHLSSLKPVSITPTSLESGYGESSPISYDISDEIDDKKSDQIKLRRQRRHKDDISGAHLSSLKPVSITPASLESGYGESSPISYDISDEIDDKESDQIKLRRQRRHKDTFDLKSSSTECSTDEYNELHQKQSYVLRKQKNNKSFDAIFGGNSDNTSGYSDHPTHDNDDSKKRGRKWQGRQGRNKRKPQWIIDRAAWKSCISNKNTYLIDSLLSDKILPDMDLLTKACQVFELKFRRLICDGICKYIVSKSSHIIYVYPATMVDEATKEIDDYTITFVVVLRENVDLGNEYKFLIKNTKDPAPQENVEIKICEKENEVRVSKNETDSNITMLTKCIQNHSTSLRKHHTNVCRISHSGFKSKGFGKEDYSIDQIDCITLYVYAKGFVPLGETLLPETLDVDGSQVLVDIREGFVEAYAGNHGPYDTLENVRIGCSIGGEPRKHGVNGTLGGVLEMGGTDFCLSSAHVFLSANEIKQLEMQDTPLLEINHCAKPVYQPHDNYLKHFGICRTAVYKEGGNGATGVDVVSIRIENRNPNTGKFPMSDGGQESDKEYSLGKVYNREEIRNVLNSDANRCFYKYGCGTKWTTGKFRSDCATFCAPHPVQDGNTDFEICLHNQFEIYSDAANDFAGKSDSGALVFMEDKNELVAVGMVVAGMAGEVCFVTPLDEILKALIPNQKNGLKNFTTGVNSVLVNAAIAKLNCDMSHVDDKMGNIECSIEVMKTDIKVVQDSVNRMDDKMERIMRLLEKI